MFAEMIAVPCLPMPTDAVIPRTYVPTKNNGSAWEPLNSNPAVPTGYKAGG
jgi:hypothetical protein